MDAKSLTVTVLLTANKGEEEQVRKALLEVVEPSRCDEGCLNYDLHQSMDDPTAFMFHETWQMKHYLDRHLAKPELKAVLERVAPMLSAPPQILLWEKLQ